MSIDTSISMDTINQRFKIITYSGLFFVLVLTTIFWMPEIYKALLPENFELRNYMMQGMDWLVVLVIFVLIIWGEKNKLTTLRFGKLNFETFSLGMALGGFSMLYIALHRFALNTLNIQTGFEQQIKNPALESVGPEFIFVYGIFSLLTASFAEEIIYRGYATERLLMLKQSKTIAFLLPLIAFVLMHYRKGLDHMIIVLVVGGLMQYFYIKYRNLTINVVGHMFIDSMAYAGILYEEFGKA